MPTLIICDTEPIAIEGLRAVLEDCADLRLIGAEASLLDGMEMARQRAPNIMVLDKAFGIHAVLDCLKRLRALRHLPAAVVWGANMTEAEALRFVQAGAQGLARKTADTGMLLACLRSVAAGNTWLEDAFPHTPDRTVCGIRSNLTTRELQVVDLIEQGMRNRDIAANLGIRPGTVKIHLKHIFEKTGIRGRYGLALTGLKEKGLLSLPVS